MRYIAVFIIIALTLMGLYSFYVGRKVKQTFKEFNLTIKPIIYWPIYTAIVVIIFFFFPVLVVVWLYIGMFFMVYDVIRFILKLFSGRNKEDSKALKGWAKAYMKGLTPVAIAVLLTVYSYFNVTYIVVKDYEINVNKTLQNDLNIILVSDTHVGTAVHEKELIFIKDTINDIHPDLVILDGDIFDESTTEEEKQLTYEIFGQIESVYGTYYVHGNHDTSDFIRAGMENAGITVLNDKIEFIDNSFYIIGRKDALRGLPRLSLEELIEDTDETYPIIVFDHQPVELKKGAELGVDLQLSGHSHSGQIFPANFFTNIVNEWGYGLKTIGDYQIIVTSGAGVWGAPVRSGSRSEIVNITIRGQE